MRKSQSTTTPKSVKLTAIDIRELNHLANGCIMIRDMQGVRIGHLLSNAKSSVARLNKFIKAGYVETQSHSTLVDTFRVTDAGRAALQPVTVVAEKPAVSASKGGAFWPWIPLKYSNSITAQTRAMLAEDQAVARV